MSQGKGTAGHGEEDWHRAILDAIPHPVFVVDRDVRIRDLNAAARQLCEQEREAVLQQRGGEVLHCLHSKDVAEGCGKGPRCKDCVIRNSVTACLDGQKTNRARTRVEFVAGAERQPMDLLVTANPLLREGEMLALLLLEDLTELLRLQAIVPICMMCKKIRSEEEYWLKVEEYFRAQAGLMFSHGLCPECAEKFRSQPFG